MVWTAAGSRELQTAPVSAPSGRTSRQPPAAGGEHVALTLPETPGVIAARQQAEPGSPPPPPGAGSASRAEGTPLTELEPRPPGMAAVVVAPQGPAAMSARGTRGEMPTTRAAPSAPALDARGPQRHASTAGRVPAVAVPAAALAVPAPIGVSHPRATSTEVLAPGRPAPAAERQSQLLSSPRPAASPQPPTQAEPPSGSPRRPASQHREATSVPAQPAGDLHAHRSERPVPRRDAATTMPVAPNDSTAETARVPSRTPAVPSTATLVPPAISPSRPPSQPVRVAARPPAASAFTRSGTAASQPTLHIGTIDVTIVPPPAPVVAAPARGAPTAAPGPLSRAAGPWYGLAQR